MLVLTELTPGPARKLRGIYTEGGVVLSTDDIRNGYAGLLGVSSLPRAFLGVIVRSTQF